MKTQISLKFKVAKAIIGMAAFLPMVGFAALAHADTTANTATAQTTDASQVSAFCANVDSSTINLDALISKKEADYDTSKATLSDALTASRKATDKELYDERVAANADYSTQFKTLAASATTPAEQAAVTTFKKTVLQAIATRRANVDLAIQNYRNGVDAILASRDTVYASALTTFKASVDQVPQSGSSGCAAESAFQTAMGNVGDSTQQLQTLASTRDTKVSAAGTKFSLAIDAAAATLKTALGQ